MTAAGMTAFVVVALNFYACTPKFTICGGITVVLVCVISFSIAVSYLLTFGAWWHPMVTAIVVLLYGILLSVTTVRIAYHGEYNLHPDDYTIGALMHYFELMVLFYAIAELMPKTTVRERRAAGNMKWCKESC